MYSINAEWIAFARRISPGGRYRAEKSLLIILSLVVLLAFTACGGTKTDSSSDGKLAVSVTFDALGEFTRAVGGDKSRFRSSYRPAPSRTILSRKRRIL
jgi:hypothetical protein